MSVKSIDFNQTTKLGATPLSLAIEYNQLKTVKILLDGGAKIEKFDNAVLGVSYSPLNLASTLSNKEMVKLLLTYKADVNVVDSLGYTPLQNIFSKPRYNKADLEIAKMLVEYGANIYVITPDGKKLENLVPKGKKPELISFLNECYEKDRDKNRSILQKSPTVTNDEVRAANISTTIEAPKPNKAEKELIRRQSNLGTNRVR